MPRKPRPLDEVVDLTPRCDTPLLTTRGFIYYTMTKTLGDSDFIGATYAFARPTYDQPGDLAPAWKVVDYLSGGTAWRAA